MSEWQPNPLLQKVEQVLEQERAAGATGRAGAMTTCKICSQALDPSNDRELTENDVVQIGRHLNRCPGCLHVFQFMTSLDRLGRHGPLPLEAVRELERMEERTKALLRIAESRLEVVRAQAQESEQNHRTEREIAISRSTSLLERLAAAAFISDRQRYYFLQTVEDRLANEDEASTANDVQHITLSLAIDLVDVIWRSRSDRPPSSRPRASLATVGISALAGGLGGLAIVSNVVTVLGAHLTVEQLLAGTGCTLVAAAVGGWVRFHGRPRREQ